MEDNIIFYTTGCPKCAILKRKLDAAGVAYDSCDDVQEMLALGLKSAPVLSVNGKNLNFGDAVHWANEKIDARLASD